MPSSSRRPRRAVTPAPHPLRSVRAPTVEAITGPPRPGTPATTETSYIVLYWESQTCPPHTLTIWHHIVATTYDIEKVIVTDEGEFIRLWRIKKRLQLLVGVYRGRQSTEALTSTLEAIQNLEDVLFSPSYEFTDARKLEMVNELRKVAAAAFNSASTANWGPVSWVALP